MSKLVVFLPDGRLVDVKLERERVTIGRRADNDLCLPYPAVSGEHAAVVTILADSFLEDLGSTNGTLVNGKAVAKHFLRDRDHIDIGKHKIVYVVDDAAKLEPDPPDVAQREARLAAERVDAARAKAARAAGPGAAARSPAGDPALAALADELAAMPASASIDSLLDAPEGGFPVGGAAVATPDATGGHPAGADGARTALPAVASLRVLDGPAAGQELALTRDEVVVGRPGRAVAAIRRTAAGLRLVPLEGGAVTVNGAVAGPEGVPLVVGDRIGLAGVALEIAAPAD
jgi:predicted component of type VI protein secretion system